MRRFRQSRWRPGNDCRSVPALPASLRAPAAGQLSWRSIGFFTVDTKERQGDFLFIMISFLIVFRIYDMVLKKERNQNMKKFLNWCNRSDSLLARVLPGSWLLTFLFDGYKVFENGITVNAIFMFLICLFFGGYLLFIIFFMLPKMMLENEHPKTTNIQAITVEIAVMICLTAYLLGRT